MHIRRDSEEGRCTIQSDQAVVKRLVPLCYIATEIERNITLNVIAKNMFIDYKAMHSDLVQG